MNTTLRSITVAYAIAACTLFAAASSWASGTSNRHHGAKACKPRSHRHGAHCVQLRRKPPARYTKRSRAQKPVPHRRPAQTKAVVGGQATPFASNSVWNQQLASNAARDPKSSKYVSNLLGQISRDGTWINTYAYSTPVFKVSRQQPAVRVSLGNNSSNPTAAALRQSWLAVPVPPHAQPATGSDAHMVVWQPSTDRMWEFWQMKKERDGWHAQWGGMINKLSSNPGYYTTPSQWGATATSLPLLGGLIRPSELAAGHIDHALAIAIPAARAAYFAWPAQRTDGSVWSAAAIPEGQRFRLDRRLDLRKMRMAPIVRMIAVAAQKYGIIVRDQASAVTFYAEDTDAEGLRNPYYGPGGYFHEQYVNNLLKRFPWSHLQALRDRMACCWHAN